LIEVESGLRSKQTNDPIRMRPCEYREAKAIEEERGSEIR